jgi:S1-C subfamily serine protease
MTTSQPEDSSRARFGPDEVVPFSSPYAPPYPGSYRPYAPPAGYAPYPPPMAASRAAAHRRRLAAGLGAAAVAGAVALALGLAGNATHAVNGSGLASGQRTVPGSNGSGGGNAQQNPFGNYPFGGSGGSSTGSGRSGAATAAQQVGVVDIDTVLKYQGAAAAGTGVVVDSTGDVLTNNHVINGATTIKVTVVTTGKTYTAKVVGTAPTKDIALIHLQHASGLQTAAVGDSGTVRVGDPVTGVGNAGGRGGTPSAAKGKVIATDKTITASDQDGSGAETLHGVFVTNAPIQPGDSGGPLYNANDQVVGIDTAASTHGTTRGFAIPIKSALAVADRIERGVQTSAIHIGYPGFLGIEVAPTNTSGIRGAEIGGIIPGLPAQRAGLTAGEVITSVDGARITSPQSLKKVIFNYGPGDRVTVGYVDQAGSSRQVALTLATGPAD